MNETVRRWWREYNVEIIGSLILHGGLAMLLPSKGHARNTQPKPVTKINVVSLGSIKGVPDRAFKKRVPLLPPKPVESAPRAEAPTSAST